MGACTLAPGNYCARLMNSIIGLGVSMSLALFVCWERDGIALGRNGEAKNGGKEVEAMTREEGGQNKDAKRKREREGTEGRREGRKIKGEWQGGHMFQKDNLILPGNVKQKKQKHKVNEQSSENIQFDTRQLMGSAEER